MKQNFVYDDDENGKNNAPPPEMLPLSLTEQAKRDRRFHILLVFVIFQTLVIIALFIAVIYKFIDVASGL